MNGQSILEMTVRAVEAGLLPDFVIRAGIRRLLRSRLQQLSEGSDADQQVRTRLFRQRASQAAIAEIPEAANQQHYEVPAQFFQHVLGHRLKYSCGFWPTADSTLDQSEDAALQLTCEHADIRDGMRILELGCGWGSLSLWLAEHYPRSSVTAVSNSHGQRQFIEQQADQAGLTNLTVVTADMNQFEPAGEFDRILSVEMFEHMRNHQELLRRISGWLVADGKLLVHIFCHRRFDYLFESRGAQDWMSTYFFTGGMMPSASLFSHYNHDLQIARQWTWDGTHYARTCRGWLQQMDAERAEIRELFADCYGPDQAKIWIQRWRIFFMACEELFAWDDGQEWFVSHYLFQHQTAAELSNADPVCTASASFQQH